MGFLFLPTSAAIVFEEHDEPDDRRDRHEVDIVKEVDTSNLRFRS